MEHADKNMSNKKTTTTKQKQDEQVVSLWMIVSLGATCLLLSQFLYWIGNTFVQLNDFTRADYMHTTITFIFTMVGGFKLYFYAQELLRETNREFRVLDCFIDDYIPLLPDFIWAYTLIDLVIMSLIIPCARDMAETMRISFGLLVVVVCNCICFLAMPTTVPRSFRLQLESDKIPGWSVSKAFLKVVHGVDDPTCVFPSGHCSLAMYLSMCLFHVFGYWTLLNPFLIALSCVFTKQHVIVDTVVGSALGYIIYVVTQTMYV
jgi:membrane-associated phospholipid phosphatase